MNWNSNHAGHSGCLRTLGAVPCRSARLSPVERESQSTGTCPVSVDMVQTPTMSSTERTLEIFDEDCFHN